MSSDEILSPRPVERTYLVDDLHVRSDGSGRVVEAYAAVFGTKAEVRDQDGHYHEENDPSSFNRTIQHKGVNFGVLFNHGRTIDGTPNPMATMPIGVPLEVRPDDKGVYTVTRYIDNPLADQVLSAIKDGALKAQSYSGRFLKSVRTYPEGRARSASLPTIRRMEIDMREYGPAVFAQFSDAAILGTRADVFVRSLLACKPEDRLQWLQQFEGVTTPGDLDTEPFAHGTPDGTADQTGDSREHSARSESVPLRDYLKAERLRRGI